MKSKGNFDFGNKGIYDIKTETKDQSVVEADKSAVKKLNDPSTGDQSDIMENEDNDKKKKRWSKQGATGAIPGALSSLGATIISATSR